MRLIWRVTRTELQTLFYSPIAWFILIVFSVQAYINFTDIFDSFVKAQLSNYKIGNLTVNIFSGNRGLFMQMQAYLYFYIPLLTMGMVSREINSGSIKLLYSSPITNAQIIWGKFIALITYALIMLLVFVIPAVYCSFSVDNFDWPLVMSGILGLFLLICAYGAIGLFMSSLTSYQVVAAMGTIVVLAALGYVGRLGQDIAYVRDITYWLSINGRSNQFISGLICSEDILYFLTVIGLFLSLSILRLNSIRQRTRRWKVVGRYCGVIAVVILVGYFSSRPIFKKYIDTTYTKVCTLTSNSQQIMRQLKGGITMTTYSNALDLARFTILGTPKYELSDIRRFEQYIRFKPETKMKYVRYYAAGPNEESLEKRFPGMSDYDRMLRVMDNQETDSSLYFKDKTEIDKIENVASEGYHLVKTLTRESGEKTFLRYFNDMMVYPEEPEISAAFMRLVMKVPTVGFVEGNGQRSASRFGDRDYGNIVCEKMTRTSLINQGFDVLQFTLDNPVPEVVNILVIADMKSPFTDTQLKNFNDYIDRGGNLIFLSDPGRQSIVNPYLERFGVCLTEGRLVQPSADFQSDLVRSIPTWTARKMSYIFNRFRRQSVVSMPGTSAIQYRCDKGFITVPWFVSDTSATTWNELETINFVDDSVYFHPQANEVMRRSFTTILALYRQVDGRTQKIIISGDADCLTNSEMSQSRRGIYSANQSLLRGVFFWMTDNKLPIDVRRPEPIDNQVFVGKQGMKIANMVFLWCIPLGLILFTILMWIRRRAR